VHSECHPKMRKLKKVETIRINDYHHSATEGSENMPEISRFFGIIIKMLFNDHKPPHFHAEYGEYRIAIRISDLSILKGSFPPKALALIVEWAALHKEELIREWEASKNGNMFKIAPLE